MSSFSEYDEARETIRPKLPYWPVRALRGKVLRCVGMLETTRGRGVDVAGRPVPDRRDDPRPEAVPAGGEQRLRDADGGRGDLRVLGPAPSPLGRLRGEYRAQLLVKGVNRRRMREAVVAAIAANADLQRRAIVDVDPLSML